VSPLLWPPPVALLSCCNTTQCLLGHSVCAVLQLLLCAVLESSLSWISLCMAQLGMHALLL
jgi:hypothetical protein